MIPYEGAIFDLDGTLLDSLWVWHAVDEAFFARRGMRVPANYGQALAGMSYPESAQYTVRSYCPDEDPEAIIREWIDSTAERYANDVTLKPGAGQFLRLLKSCGVRLAVATALPERLYRPCLEHLDILDLFDALCSTDDTDGRGKRGGEVFLLAAKRIGVEPSRCAVFEDVPDGLQGAKAAGMKACGVCDPANEAYRSEMTPLCDTLITDFRDLLPKCAAIFTAVCEGDVKKACEGLPGGALILCADAGYRLAKEAGYVPDVIIGDFDSADRPGGRNVHVHPVMKDDTDTMLCVRFALEAGVRDIRIIGGLGGRLDHTVANLQSMAFCMEHGAQAELHDGETNLVMTRGEAAIPRTDGKLSVFAYGGDCEGVTIKGAKYELENGTLTPGFPLGLGNDFTESKARISVKKGTLLIIWRNDPE